MDMWEGNGVWKMVDGAVYEGYFKDHKRNGKGMIRHRDGSQYEGTWEDDLFHVNGERREKIRLENLSEHYVANYIVRVREVCHGRQHQ